MRETSFDETWVQFLQDSQDIFFFGLMCGTDPHITNGGRFLEVLQVRSTPDPINADPFRLSSRYSQIEHYHASPRTSTDHRDTH